jgi:hypothetical protein
VTVNAPTPAISFGQHAPHFDLTDALPPQAAERLRALKLAAKESHAIIPAFEEIREASAARTNAASALKRLTDNPQEGGFKLAPDDLRVVAATRTLEKATAAFERLSALQATRGAAFQSNSAAFANVEAWLRGGRPQGTVLLDDESDPPKLNKGETLLDAIARVQRRVREVKADLHRISSSPMPSSHARAKMRAQIEALAARGAPSVSNLVEHDGEVEFQTQQAQTQVFNASPGAIGFTVTPDAVALTCWLHRAALVDALDKEITAEADDAAALSLIDRELRTAEAMSDLQAVERAEAALIWRGMGEKLPVAFRADINPVAVLGIALVTKPNGHLPASSPGQSYDIVRPGGGRRR